MHYASYAAMSIRLRAARDIYSGSSSFARRVWRKFEIMQAPMLLIATTISSFVNGCDERGGEGWWGHVLKSAGIRILLNDVAVMVHSYHLCLTDNAFDVPIRFV